MFLSLLLVVLVFVEDEWRRLCWSIDDLLGDFFSRLTSEDFLLFSACWCIVSIDFFSDLIFFDPRNSISGIALDLESLFVRLIFSSFLSFAITIVRLGDLLYGSVWRNNWSLRVSSSSWCGDIESCVLCLDDVEWLDFFLCFSDEWICSVSDVELTDASLR